MQQNSAKVAVAVNVRLKYSSTSIELKKPTKLISLTVVVGHLSMIYFSSFCLFVFLLVFLLLLLPSSFTSLQK